MTKEELLREIEEWEGCGVYGGEDVTHLLNSIDITKFMDNPEIFEGKDYICLSDTITIDDTGVSLSLEFEGDGEVYIKFGVRTTVDKLIEFLKKEIG